jgi:cysteine desulfurase
VEHAAVTKAIRVWKKQGRQVEYIPIRNAGLDMEAMAKAVDGNTVLVSVMLVNNEVGTIFPIREVKEIIARKGSPALLHCDAVQGFGKVPFDARDLGADLISVSAHKIHGVKGSGALYVKKGIKIHAVHFGGGQEGGLRPGTESTPLIAAFGEAVRITFGSLHENIAHMERLRDYCLDALTERIPGAILNSDKKGAPHIVNFSLPGRDSLAVVKALSAQGICISNKAACKSGSGRRGPSVLESYGVGEALASSALRVSFSAENTFTEIEELITALGNLRI